VTSAQFGASEAPIPIQPHLAAGLRPRGVRVHALGPLRVGLGRLPLHALGGAKAGANQALALFAFLFDRGMQGVEKDEAIETIWPDASLTMADTAFHRTLLGLRGSLRAGGFGDAAVEFHNGRYVLASGLVSWADTWELERMINASATTSDPQARIDLLEQCRQLNQADYMDDCPFFGTSVYVEARRSMLRAVRQAVLAELAGLYRDAGHLALGAIRAAEADAVGELVTVDAQAQ
jgi:two-component SAPR family response regulator